MSVTLPLPALGEEQLRHDADFERLDATLGAIRDLVNVGIDVLNDLGAGLPRLPEGSLEELLVLPLTGDHRRIRQNAEAVRIVAPALRDYGRDVAGLALAVERDWGGEAALTFLTRLGRHAVAANAAGALVAGVAPVFEEIATFSEALAIRVEELVVELVERGQRLVRRLATRAAGPLGWGVFATDVAMHGWDAITDLIDDVRRLHELIETLLALQGEVVGWVHDRVADLQALLELPTVVAGALRGG